MIDCHDCGAREGEIHELGCDMESCPFCGGQLLSCDCCYEKLGIDHSEGTWTYKHGLTKKQGKAWLALLQKKGRIPYILWPVICARCGCLWPDLFMVSKVEWCRYIEPRERDKVLCRPCYDKIKRLTRATAGG